MVTAITWEKTVLRNSQPYDQDCWHTDLVG